MNKLVVMAMTLPVLAGCSTLSQIPDVEVRKVEPIVWPTQPATAAPAANAIPTGSLYAAASYRPAFEDPRARMVGDSLTVEITESLTASQTTNSTVNRESSLEGGVSALPFLGSSLLGKLGMKGDSSNDFSGKGATQAKNNFSGTITATVMEVLPNGHLVVAGEKQIGVNQNVDVLRFSGTVDPRNIRPGNVVASTSIANTRVESRGRGAQFDAQTFGWISRFFLSLLPF